MFIYGEIRMKNWFFMTAIIITVIMTTGITIAADNDNNRNKPIPSVRDQIRSKGPQPIDPEARIKQMHERKSSEINAVKKEPTALIKQLEEIKALAKKEKADKTITLIDKLIDKTKKDMDAKIAAIEARHARLQEILSNNEDRASRNPAATRTTAARRPKTNETTIEYIPN
jgi:S-adenosylmethionine synthetase